jgi:hypothetical protein
LPADALYWVVLQAAQGPPEDAGEYPALQVQSLTDELWAAELAYDGQEVFTPPVQ